VAEGPRDAGSASGAEAPIPQQELRDRLATRSAAILGCGGLGSNCAAMLVRSGVLDLTLVDFDVVEADNLNRQLFFGDQIGRPKVEALADTLRRIDPDVRLRLVPDCITEANLTDLVAGADVVIEAVDGAETKALILAVCARDLPDVPVVAASGLAGHDSANLIETVRLGENLWVTGDLVTDVREGHALVASRVMVAAAHQAHAAIRVLLDLDPV
jgi:sulfur carrier protein ThiS adenylyltransferase